jgi:F-type H+-transporting ATPase subunit delta
MAAFAARYASAFLEVVTAARLDTAAIDRQFGDFLATWNGSAELREFFVNPAIPAVQKVGFLDTLNRKLGLRKELRNLLAVLISNDRIAAVSEVAAVYRRLLQEQLGIRQAEIVTARELGVAERRALVARSASWPVRASRPASSWMRRSSAARWCASAPRSTTGRCAEGWTG